jgi:hypothetical protein
MAEKISIFKKTFWDLWLQKCFRNVASVKYQWMLLLYIPVIWGMFNINGLTNEPWISATEGLTFLGGGFITLATSRLIARTKLVENKGEEELDTDK